MTSYELHLPANFKARPVINIEYLKEFHASPARFVNRPDDGKNRNLDPEDVVEKEEIEKIRDHRESRQGRLQYRVAIQNYLSQCGRNELYVLGMKTEEAREAERIPRLNAEEY